MTLPLLTMTGIDSNTDPKWITNVLRNNILATGYSALEFAILRSPRVDQSPRYPNRDVIRKLLSGGRPGDFAYHLCGRYAQMVHDLEWSELCDIIDFSQVGRVQVNSRHGDSQAVLNLYRFSVHIGKPVVMQWREQSFPAVPTNIHLLQDNSGGNGILETNWAKPDATNFKNKNIIGYAGGLGPSNVANSLEKIVKASSGKKFWIDCETSLRNSNDYFDMGLADEMIEKVRYAMADKFMEKK